MPIYRCWGVASPQETEQKEEQEKEVTAGVANVVVLPDEGKTLSKVTVKPTPSEMKTITASDVQQIVTPTSGKLLSKVTVNPPALQNPKSVSVTPSKNEDSNFDGYTQAATITPDSGYLAMRSVQVKVPQLEKYNEDLGTPGDEFESAGWTYDEDPMMNPDAMPTGLAIRPSKIGMIYTDLKYVINDIIDNTVAGVNAPATGYEDVLPAYGKAFVGLRVYATPSEEKTATPSSSQQVITPTTGKLMSKVTIGAVQTETKTVTPSTSKQEFTPSTGKFFSKLTVNAIQTETKAVTATTSQQTITPTSGKYLTQVTVNPQTHTGSRSNESIPHGTTKQIDLTATHNVRYVNVSSPAVNNQTKYATFTPTSYNDGDSYTGYYAVSKDSSYDGMTTCYVRVPVISASGLSFTGFYDDGGMDDPIEDDEDLWNRQWKMGFTTNSSGYLFSGQNVNADVCESGYKKITENGTTYLFPSNNKVFSGVKIVTEVDSGEMTAETLWTNPSPSSTFAAQTITLSKSLTANNYKYIGIEYRCSLSYANTMEILVTPTQLKNSGTTYYPTICLGSKVASSSGRRLRFVEYVSSTQLSFTTGYQNGSSTTSSGYAIPTKIKGYK